MNWLQFSAMIPLNTGARPVKRPVSHVLPDQVFIHEFLVTRILFSPNFAIIFINSLVRPHNQSFEPMKLLLNPIRSSGKLQRLSDNKHLSIPKVKATPQFLPEQRKPNVRRFRIQSQSNYVGSRMKWIFLNIDALRVSWVLDVRSRTLLIQI